MNKLPTPIKKIQREWKSCNECGLGATARNHVFYRGDCPCDVLLIGEAPGKSEDLLGEPFVGKAGDTLKALIKDAIAELRKVLVGNDVWGGYNEFTHGICNILACRPTDVQGNDRPPSRKEAKDCSPRLADTIRAANPKLIILLGRSAETHYKMQEGIASCPVVHLEHPSFINRNGGIGSTKYDSVLIRLVDALETHLYGEESSSQKSPGKGSQSSKSSQSKQKRLKGS